MMESRTTQVRNVQKVGYSTFTVSLPKGWAQRQGVKKGSKVVVRELPDGSLVLSIAEREQDLPRRFSANLELSEEEGEVELERGIIALYQAGFDTIRVQAPSSSLEVLRKVRNRLSGIEVVEEREKFAVLEVVLDYLELGFNRILGRMVALLQSSLENIQKYSTENNVHALQKVVERDDEIDKFYFLLARQASLCFRRPEILSKLGLSSQGEVLPLLYYGKTLERLGDTLTQLAMYALDRRAPIPENIVILLQKALEKAVLSFDAKSATAMKELTRMHYEFYASQKPGDLLSNPILYLTGNFLSLCVDVIEARIEYDAVKPGQ
ncbi:MAG: phosphate uptake regulator PhoU [Thermofilaceae archaeon]